MSTSRRWTTKWQDEPSTGRSRKHRRLWSGRITRRLAPPCLKLPPGLKSRSQLVGGRTLPVDEPAKGLDHSGVGIVHDVCVGHELIVVGGRSPELDCDLGSRRDSERGRRDAELVPDLRDEGIQRIEGFASSLQFVFLSHVREEGKKLRDRVALDSIGPPGMVVPVEPEGHRYFAAFSRMRRRCPTSFRRSHSAAPGRSAAVWSSSRNHIRFSTSLRPRAMRVAQGSWTVSTRRSSIMLHEQRNVLRR